MNEIDSVSPNMYYAGVQNSTNEALKNRKSEKSSSVKRSKFSDILKTETENSETSFNVAGLPPEISKMSLEDAAIYLQDAVNNAGNVLEQEVTVDNIKEFKKAVGQFISFIVQNNFEVTTKRSKRIQFKSPVNYFSTYNTKCHPVDPKVQVQVINQKLDELAQETLATQMNNLKILQKVDEIKGLIVDLMSS